MFLPTKRRPGEFRLIRGLSVAHNTARFQKYVARLNRRMKSDPAIKRMRVRKAKFRQGGKA